MPWSRPRCVFNAIMSIPHLFAPLSNKTEYVSHLEQIGLHQIWKDASVFLTGKGNSKVRWWSKCRLGCYFLDSSHEGRCPKTWFGWRSTQDYWKRSSCCNLYSRRQLNRTAYQSRLLNSAKEGYEISLCSYCTRPMIMVWPMRKAAVANSLLIGPLLDELV